MDKIDNKVSEDFWISTSNNWGQKRDKLLQAIEMHETSSVNYLNAGIKVLRLVSTLHENFLSKGQHEKRDTLNLILSKKHLVNANLDIELCLPFTHVAEYVKTRDNRELRDDYRKFVTENVEEMAQLEQGLKQLKLDL